MDLESDDEDKENDVADIKEVTEDDEIDEKERSHCMEEMWEGGGSIIKCFKIFSDFNPVCFHCSGVKLPPEPRGECSRELQVINY